MDEKETNVCFICSKRIGLCVIKCRCGGNFCKKHVAPELHMCSFDYKLFGQELIRKNNPKVVPSKMKSTG
jgi:predicted nucleic acid binding AN1-type Zn finger protein